MGARVLGAALATVVLMAGPVGAQAGQRPVAQPVAVSATAGGAAAAWTPDVADVDSESLRCEIVGDQPAATVRADCSAGTFKPGDTPGTVTFQYQAVDETGAGDPATVTATVTEVSAEPAVAKWTVTRTWWWIGGFSNSGRVLPVTEGGTPTFGQRLGTVADGDGDSAGVTAGNQPVYLRFEDLDDVVDVGTWTGNIDLLPAVKDKGAVELTVNYSHGWLFALLPLLSGLGLAWFLLRRHRAPRTRTRLEERTTRLRMDLTHAQSQFDGQTYKITNAMTESLDEQSETLKRLEWPAWFTLSADYQEFKDVEAALDQAEAARKLWGPADPSNASRADYAAYYDDEPDKYLPEKLGALASALASFEPDDPPDGALKTGETKPRCARDAEKLCNGSAYPGSEVKLGQVAELDARVTKAQAMLSAGWAKLATDLDEVEDLTERLTSEMPEPDQERLIKLRGMIQGARWDLWRAKDADDLAARAAAAELAEAESLLGRLSHHYADPPPPPPTWILTSWGQISYVTGRPLFDIPFFDLATTLGQDPLEDAPPPSPPPSTLLAQLRGRRKLLDGLVLVTLLAIAVWAGMKAIYLDPTTFGTLPDYVGALTWGAVTATALTGISSALEAMAPPTPKPEEE